jgi:hypothetical protein
MNKWLYGPPSESGQKQLCLRPESNRSRRTVRQLPSVNISDVLRIAFVVQGVWV